MRARVVVSLDGAIVTEVELTKDVTVVGRHPACDICIDNPAISGRHMLFRIVDKTVFAEDLASTNGTKVNGHPTQHQVVHHLDLIEVGHHKLHFFDEVQKAGLNKLEGLRGKDLTRAAVEMAEPDLVVRGGVHDVRAVRVNHACLLREKLAGNRLTLAILAHPGPSH